MERGPVLIAVAATTLFGFAAGWALHTPDPCPVCEVCPPLPPPCPTCAEIPVPPPGTPTLEEVQAKVVSLEKSIAAKEKELAKVEKEADKAGDKRDEFAAKAKALAAELAALKAELTTVQEEKARLEVELGETKVALQDQIVQTTVAKEDAARWKNKSDGRAWDTFVNASKVTVCEKGNVKKLDECHDAVQAALPSNVRDAFVRCVASGQAEPSLVELPKDAQLPPHSIPLRLDKPITPKVWYVQLCDPDLPEAGERDEATP